MLAGLRRSSCQQGMNGLLKVLWRGNAGVSWHDCMLAKKIAKHGSGLRSVRAERGRVPRRFYYSLWIDAQEKKRAALQLDVVLF